MTRPTFTSRQGTLAFLLITCATVLAFAATDLVLPAIPGLPAALGGTPAQAQFVLASFTAGVAAGLILFGELGARFAQRPLLVAALSLFSAASFCAALSPSMEILIAIRFVQGLAASAAAVFGPGIIKRVFAGDRALRALGVQSSVESLAPALAPIAGAWLLAQFSWQAGFVVLGLATALLAAVFLSVPGAAFAPPAGGGYGAGYTRLLRDAAYLRWALSQAFTLGGLLIIVLGAPAVMIRTMNGSIADFILMQVMGVATFIAAANTTGRLCRRFGVERVVMAGSALSAAGACAILAYALAGGNAPLAMALLFVPINLGLGLRGPPGFFQAILAARGDDSRGAALMILAILLVTASGTAIVAPFITRGLVPLALAAAAAASGSVAVLVLMRRRSG